MRKLDKVNCPKCGLEMDKGYVYSPEQILWTKSAKKTMFEFDYENLVGPSTFKFKKLSAIGMFFKQRCKVIRCFILYI